MDKHRDSFISLLKEKFQLRWINFSTKALRIIEHPWRSFCHSRFVFKLIFGWQGRKIPQDEFHSSLNMNSRAMINMKDWEKKKYILELERRRSLAHNKSI